MKKQNTKYNNEAFSLNWGDHSDNYVTGTAPNGYTILASRPAVFLSLRLSSENKQPSTHPCQPLT